MFASIGADSALDLSFAPNANGSATLVIRATDSGAAFVEDTITVTATPVNDNPVVASAIPDTTVAEDAVIGNYRDLNGVFADIEDGSSLAFTIQSNSNPGLLFASIGADSALDLSFAPNASGSATLVLRATDSEALFVEDTFTITVTPVNDVPVVVSADPGHRRVRRRSSDRQLRRSQRSLFRHRERHGRSRFRSRATATRPR